MLTAHAFTMDTLKTSIDMGAKGFLSKEKVRELVPFLEEVITAVTRRRGSVSQSASVSCSMRPSG